MWLKVVVQSPSLADRRREYIQIELTDFSLCPLYSLFCYFAAVGSLSESTDEVFT